MRILEIIEKEAAGNYKNGAVFGGFAEFLLSWAEKNGAAELARLAGEYAEAPLIERPSLLRKIKAEAELLPPEKEETAERAEASLSERPSLETPIQYLKNVGPKRVALFQHLGVNTIGDLLFYFPRDYRDRRQAQEIGALSVGDAASVRGVVTRVEELRPNPRIHILKACVSDGAGLIPAVWFNQKFLQKQLVKGREMLVCGKVEKKYGQLQLSVQEYEFLDGEGADSPGIVPVYRATESLPQKFLRGSVKTALEKYARFVKEILPEELVRARALPPRAQALRDMHFPASFEAKEAARRRFAYEELLVLQLVICARGQDKPEQGVAHPADPELFERFSRELPYELTGAQKRVINEIFADMEAPAPMARLVQGDVGCGKTAVAAAALYKACRAGYQATMMAPTEILALQHHHSLSPLLARLGVRAELLLGSLPAKAREGVLARTASGETGVLIGTHALIQEKVVFANLSLAVTDEQHRFGVMQRTRLQEKGGAADILVMTATPIPRTLALAFYGDLQLSVIDEAPPGRQPISTYAVGYDYEERIWAFLEKEIAKGRQVFIVCPLVEESEKTDLQSAAQLAQRLREEVFPHRKTGLLHGRLKFAEKERLMREFAQNELEILVSTTVVEVGVNVPNATVMLVRDAERFGLAQLHQLRGRIGRGAEQSFCVLMHNARSAVARERMKIMSETCDGFKIAEADLALRGPGEFFGTRQHGVPELQTANLFTDAKILEEARTDALRLLRLEGFAREKEFAFLRYHMEQKKQMLN